MADLRGESAAYAEAVGIAAFHARNPLGGARSRDAGRVGAARLRQRMFRASHLDRRTARADRAGAATSCRRERGRSATVRTAGRHETKGKTPPLPRRNGASTPMLRSNSEGRRLIEAWDRHFADLKQLHVDARRPGLGALTALADWVGAAARRQPRAALPAGGAAGGQPASGAAPRVARRTTSDTGRRSASALEDERRRLEAGIDTAPPLPYTRDAAARDASCWCAALASWSTSATALTAATAHGPRGRARSCRACSTPGFRPTAVCEAPTAECCCMTRSFWTDSHFCPRLPTGCRLTSRLKVLGAGCDRRTRPLGRRLCGCRSPRQRSLGCS